MSRVRVTGRIRSNHDRSYSVLVQHEGRELEVLRSMTFAGLPALGLAAAAAALGLAEAEVAWTGDWIPEDRPPWLPDGAVVRILAEDDDPLAPRQGCVGVVGAYWLTDGVDILYVDPGGDRQSGIFAPEDLEVDPRLTEDEELVVDAILAELYEFWGRTRS